jgi:hypothetical protein
MGGSGNLRLLLVETEEGLRKRSSIDVMINSRWVKRVGQFKVSEF